MGTATDGPASTSTGGTASRSKARRPDEDAKEENNATKSSVSSGEKEEQEEEGEEEGEPQNPYLNKMIAVVSGRHGGMRGTVVDVAARGGWWTVVDDHDAADDGARSRKVKNSDCRMIDVVNEAELDRYRERTGIHLSLVPPFRSTSSAAAGSTGSGSSTGSGGGRSDDDCDDGESSTAAGTRRLRKRRRRGRGEGDNHPDREVDEWKHTQPADGVTPPSWRDWRDSMSPHVIRRLVESSIPPPAGLQYRSSTSTSSGSRMRMPPSGAGIGNVDGGGDGDGDGDGDASTEEATPPHVLPPVTISPHDDTELPEAVRHLPPNSTVDIFDRVSGRVLSGTDAVMVRDLPAVLRCHAEYEPIVPPPSIQDAASASASASASSSVREGRSAPGLTVSASVRPQLRSRPSAMEGREVIVTGGRLRGRVGRIQCRLPGNWYVVSDLDLLGQDSDDRGGGGGMGYVIGSAHLDLLGGGDHQAEAESECQPPHHPDAGGGGGGGGGGTNITECNTLESSVGQGLDSRITSDEKAVLSS
mmetsp:Transcript_35455/g.76918  ORF Transcript_35455/g.76918 Transcript_35455/m.76918 type:complete len:530 (+) Transcript_35455:232-1821(+)